MKDYQLLQQKYTLNTYANRGLTLVSGNGVHLYSDRGEKYLDLMSNYGVSIFGHNHPELTKTIGAQLTRVMTLHNSFNNDQRAEASRLLIEKCGSPYTRVFWSNSGAEAFEAALKFAVIATGRKKFIACKNSFHGKTLGALSATGHEKYRNPFLPLLWHFEFIDYNNDAMLSETIDAGTAAFLVEPIQGEGGVIVPSNGYLKSVQKICKEKNILLILDEIQTGTGRTGSFLASHHESIAADILCLGKGLAGGIPAGATVVTTEVAEQIPKYIHTSTFGGNPLACAGVLAVLNLLNHSALEHIRNSAKYLFQQLKELKHPSIVEARGSGLMAGIEVAGNRDFLLKQLQQQHILAIPAGENVIRFLPPYIIENNHIDQLREVLNEISHVPISAG